jgi:hypothetical protein
MDKQVQRLVADVPQHWVGDGFPVRTLFTYQDPAVDPFLLLDYAGPFRFEPAESPRGVGEHPHRGFETVTIVYQGELEHRDSSGSHGTIGAGDVQWMTAAAGVVHEEFHSPRFQRQGGTLEMVQLWVNLPARSKGGPPKYQALADAAIPRVRLPDGRGTVRVIAGSYAGAAGAADTFTPLNVWDVQLEKPGTLELEVPQGQTAIVVVQTGTIRIGEARVEAVGMAVCGRQGSRIALAAESPGRVLLLSGEPLGEPVVGQGPFVMNTREEIRQAISDYQAGRMGKLPE